MKHSIKVTLSSIATYLIVAACSGGAFKSASLGEPNPETDGSAVNAGGTSNDGSGGATVATGGKANVSSGGSSFADAMVNPVPDAKADPKAGTRIHPIVYSGDDGSKTYAVTMRDTLLNIDCYWTEQTDGSLICLPSSATGIIDSYFTDSACAQHLHTIPTSSCGVALPTLIELLPSSACQTASYYKFGGVTTAPATIYIGGPTNCVPSALPSTSVAISLGEQLPLSGFAHGSRIVE
jgi:hypothetical protein